MSLRKPNPAVLARKLTKTAFAVESLARQVAEIDGGRFAASVDNAAMALSDAAERIRRVAESRPRQGGKRS